MRLLSATEFSSFTSLGGAPTRAKVQASERRRGVAEGDRERATRWGM